jgi:hypothetical protein
MPETEQIAETQHAEADTFFDKHPSNRE